MGRVGVRHRGGREVPGPASAGSSPRTAAGIQAVLGAPRARSTGVRGQENTAVPASAEGVNPGSFLFAGAPLWIGRWAPPLARAACTRSAGMSTDPLERAETFDPLPAPPVARRVTVSYPCWAAVPDRQFPAPYYRVFGGLETPGPRVRWRSAEGGSWNHRDLRGPVEPTLRVGKTPWQGLICISGDGSESQLPEGRGELCCGLSHPGREGTGLGGACCSSPARVLLRARAFQTRVRARRRACACCLSPV